MNLNTLIKQWGHRVQKVHSVSGGCTSQNNLVLLENQQWVFVKSNAIAADQFPSEAYCLEKLSEVEGLQVPNVLCSSSEVLILEALEASVPSPHYFSDLATQLVTLHRIQADSFGWNQDNYIGKSPQKNLPRESSWKSFFWEKRLSFQLDLIKQKNAHHPLLKYREQIKDLNESLLDNHHPQASLVHGDLWSGNHFCDKARGACLIDPACSYSDREVDLALTQLFGGYPKDFYSAYQKLWPLTEGYRERFLLYNLYHLINHVNIMGDVYLSQTLETLERLSSSKERS